MAQLFLGPTGTGFLPGPNGGLGNVVCCCGAPGSACICDWIWFAPGPWQKNNDSCESCNLVCDPASIPIGDGDFEGQVKPGICLEEIPIPFTMRSEVEMEAGGSDPRSGELPPAIERWMNG